MMEKLSILQSFRGRIARRLIFALIIFSSLVTLITTAFQIVTDYRRDVTNIESKIDQIEISHLDIIIQSMWAFDDKQIETQLVSLRNLPEVEYVEISTAGQVRWFKGVRPSGNVITKSFPIFYQHNLKPVNLGTLKITATLDHVYQRLFSKVLIILVGNGIKTFLVSTFMFLIFHYLLTRHLDRLAAYVRSLKPSQEIERLILDKRSSSDELDDVVNAVNKMWSDQVTVQESLEGRIEERTRDLTKEISERKRAEQILNDAIESVRDGIVLYDANGHFVLCNEQFRKDREKVANLLVSSATLDDLHHAVAEEDIVDAEGLTPEEWMARQRERYSDLEQPFEQHEPDGRTVLVSPYRTQDGSTFIIRTDITERKKAEMELRQAQKMESLGSLAGGISHSFNNLLLPILALSGITLNRLPENSPERENLEKITLAAERARDLVRRIMVFSHQGSPKVERVILQDVIRGTLDLLAGTIPQSIRVERSLNQDADVVLADQAQIEVSLINIVSNSVEAFDGNLGTIKVSLGRVDIYGTAPATVGELHTGAYAKLTVSDNGPGMDEETQNRIFDPFFTTKGVGEGTGLGLSVTQGTVIQYGGALSVSSAQNKGTCIEIYWPLATGQQIN